MFLDPRKLRGAAALIEVAERRKSSNAEAPSAFIAGQTKPERFNIEAAERLRVRAASLRPRRPVEPLLDVHFDGTRLIVTTEIDDPRSQVEVAGERLTIRGASSPERLVTLPCRVKPETLTFSVVNGILEATMIPEDVV